MRAYIQGDRQALKDFPLTHVEDPWLHITIDQITDHPAAAIPQDERDALADALIPALADFEFFKIAIGSMLSYGSGVIADCHPDDQLAALHHRVRETIRITRGDDAPASAGRRHVW